MEWSLLGSFVGFKWGQANGGVISPVLFCIYLDELLGKFANMGVGCYIGNIFVGAVAYADDIVLLAPAARLCDLCLAFVIIMR